jgi:hypothetical protein
LAAQDMLITTNISREKPIVTCLTARVLFE